jgi:hypothetical protein
MTVNFTENMSIYFDTSFGAETAQVKGVDVDGIFDEQYVDVLVGSIPVVGVKPTFQAASSDLVGVVKGDSVVVRSANYQVVTPQPDGTGSTMLILERQ